MQLVYVYFCEMMPIKHQKNPRKPSRCLYRGCWKMSIQAAEGFCVSEVLAEERPRQSRVAGLVVFRAREVCTIAYQI